MVVVQAMLQLHVDFGAEIHKGSVVFLRVHDHIAQPVEPFGGSFAQRCHDLAPDLLVEWTAFPEGFLDQCSI